MVAPIPDLFHSICRKKNDEAYLQSSNNNLMHAHTERQQKKTYYKYTNKFIFYYNKKLYKLEFKFIRLTRYQSMLNS